MIGKRWYASKTIWFGVLMILVTIAGFFGYGTWQPEPESWVTMVLQVLLLLEPIVVIILRRVTREPLRA
jgi:hypothetical protein